MTNSALSQAKLAKNDEFYTQFDDIEQEVNAYLDYNANVFRGKSVLLPCDDPEWSNFTKFFAENFVRLGLRRLVSTSFAPEAKRAKYGISTQPSLFEKQSAAYDEKRNATHGKLFVLNAGDEVSDFATLCHTWRYLEGTGDFASDEVCALRDDADFVITNPPFSLFREFVAWIRQALRPLRFLIIGNMNAVTYKEIFPLIKDNQMWLGVHNGAKIYKKHDGADFKMGNTFWFTNMEHGRRHERLQLMSMKENLRYNAKHAAGYPRYDNYDAIEVGATDAIPSDCDGVMGVPISFLDKYCPEQFEIVGMCENEDLYKLKTRKYTTQECKDAYFAKFGKNGIYDLNASGVIIVDGIKEKVYQRILIRHRR